MLVFTGLLKPDLRSPELDPFYVAGEIMRVFWI